MYSHHFLAALFCFALPAVGIPYNYFEYSPVKCQRTDVEESEKLVMILNLYNQNQNPVLEAKIGNNEKLQIDTYY